MNTFLNTANHSAGQSERHLDNKGYSVRMSAKAANMSFPHEQLIRFSDIVLSLFAIVFLAPALLAVALGVWLQDRGPVFFKHRRIGKDGKEFYCYKFRSMLTDSERRLNELLARDPNARAEWERDHKLKNDPRITPFGHFIRKTSLDEFPQLWNVLRGDMSLVGPRPIVASEVNKYGRSFKAYCSVLPGITGLWQVMGRNDVSYRRRVALDRLFAKRRTVVLFSFILAVTVPAVVFQRGSY